ncbi:uncharacterized protein LOC125858793 [Solanum stenotomum]|uniref:uncharacterized protein LOC125858793 n=1 Tax=Solanum stenotomum TaxID=172797 RepID=UPI0020D14176|nr:uncharacterized protein LOC125858793 [Solanum stenotomum]
MTNQAGQQRGNRQEITDTSRIREFQRMNPPNFTGSSVTEDPENFVEELQKVFEIMHVVNTERVELDAYQMKGVSRIWFDQWMKNRVEDAPLAKMVTDMRSRMSLFVVGMSLLSSKEGKAAMLIGDIDIARLMVYVQQGSMAQGGSKPLACAKCGRNHSGTCREGSTDRAAPRGVTSSIGGGTNRLYVITSRQKQEDSPDVVTGMI